MIWKHSEITLNTEIDSKQTEIDFATPPSSQLCLFLSLLIVAAGKGVVLSDRQVALTVAREDNTHTHTSVYLMKHHLQWWQRGLWCKTRRPPRLDFNHSVELRWHYAWPLTARCTTHCATEFMQLVWHALKDWFNILKNRLACLLLEG